MIYQILEELNQSNSSNYKLDVLKKHKDNKLLERVLKMTYDSVAFTYGVTTSRIPLVESYKNELPLESALNILETKYSTRIYTGNYALEALHEIISSLSKEDAEVFCKVVDRDLKINIGKTQINKVFKNLIFDLPYMRCSVYSEKTIKKINFPCAIQVKADGRYVSVVVDDSGVKFFSRSGEESFFPVLNELFSKCHYGVYMGELLIEGITDRAESNGLINSDNPPHDKIYIYLWDYLTLEEWSKGQSDRRYIDRLKTLKTNIIETDKIRLIPTLIAQDIQDALKTTSIWMNEGLEGSIIKDWNTPFKDHTSPTQLKLKLCIDADLRCTGFTAGTKGTKREQYFGAITYESDDGKIKGQCSGFTDAQLKEFHSKREELIGKILVVQFNDLTKAEGNDYYALSHPRFIEFRDDKTETDTLERVFELRNMAMGL